MALSERAEKLRLPFGAGKIAVYRWFPGDLLDNGNVVLFLHGWSSYALRFRQFVDPFLEKGYRVVFMDAPAHGNSSGKRTHLIEYAEAVLEVARSIGTPHAIVGHSFGGLAASFVASGHPPLKSRLEVQRVVTIGTPHSVQSIITRFSDFLNIPKPVLDALFARMSRLTGQPIDIFSTGYFTNHSRVPTLVVHDTDDRVVALSDAKEICAQADNARLMVTNGLGHRRILWDPGVVRSILEFVENGSISLNEDMEVPSDGVRLLHETYHPEAND